MKKKKEKYNVFSKQEQNLILDSYISNYQALIPTEFKEQQLLMVNLGSARKMLVRYWE